MKRFLKFAFAAFAVVALANCTNDIDEQPAHETTGGTVKLCVNATLGEDSRAVIGSLTDNKYPVTWSETGETLLLAQYINNAADAVSFTSQSYITSDANKKANFYFEIPQQTLFGDQKVYYVAGYPGEGTTFAPSNNRFNVTIPTVQTPTSTSVDPKAVFLVTQVSDGFEQQQESLNFSFEHVAAYAKMTVKNLGLTDATTITFSAPLGTNIAGSYEYNYKIQSGNAGTTNTSNSVTLNLDNVTVAEEFDVWFTLAPCNLTTFTVSFSDGEKTYTKEVDASNRQLQFSRGQVSSFTVNMEGIDDQEDEETYQQVKTDALPAQNAGNGIVADLPDSSWTPVIITTTVNGTTYILNNTLTDGTLSMTPVPEGAVKDGVLTIAPSKYQWDVVNRTAGYTFRSKGNGFLNISSGWLHPQYSSSFTIEKSGDEGNYTVKTGTDYLTMTDGKLATATTPSNFQFYSTPAAVAEQEQKEEEEKNKPEQKQSYTKVNALTAGKEYILVANYMFNDYVISNNDLSAAAYSNAGFAKSGTTFEGDGANYTFTVTSVSGGMFNLKSTSTNYFIGSSFTTGAPALGAISKPFNYNSTDGLYYTSGGTFYLYYYAGTLGYIGSGYTGNRVHIYEKQE